ncbi:MAG TPA: 4-hydroxy-tetrahydrodipicolinate reductase [Dehalococcoidia bacterium]|nr:4-hydroxy-tetrahydrodipicolinate reductase [Dehalococcoidia bacterium]
MAISVAVSGSGFMGKEVLAAVSREDDLEPVGIIEKFATQEYVSVPGHDGLIPMSSDPAALIERARPNVIVDFTNAQWTPEVARAALARGSSLVIGTTGLSDSFLKELESECKAKGVGAVVAPNFAIGAIVMIHLAKIASRFFDYAEITEMHQEKKVDAPSGTAVLTAREMVEARGKPFEHTMPEKDTLTGARGAAYGGVAIHSQRMPGFVAHHEITFGGFGQSLRIRHDSNGRDSFIPGVLMAVREVVKRKELVYGLDKLVGL